MYCTTTVESVSVLVSVSSNGMFTRDSSYLHTSKRRSYRLEADASLAYCNITGPIILDHDLLPPHATHSIVGTGSGAYDQLSVMRSELVN